MSEIPRGDIPNQAPPTTVATAPRGAHAVDDVEFIDGFASGNNAREAVDLSADPFADDLTAELAAAAPKPWHNRATVVLGALVLIVGGFLGGVQVEKHYGKTTTAANARAALSQFANARGGAGGTGGFGRGAGTGGTGSDTASAAPSTASGSSSAQTNTGKITLVDGTTIYVTLASGDVLTVKTTSTTKVSVGSVGKVSGLKAGQSVTVTGPTDSSGNVTATSITAGS
ncbi:MAG TPA: hypothetical protein VE132_18120 [Micromonosporaceae bacterium]|nr:hypothetical protein [Micromonosporaceae bacterium]